MIATASQMCSTSSSWCDENSDRHAARRLLAQHAGDQIGDDRVKPRERLVEDQQIRAWTSAAASCTRC